MNKDGEIGQKLSEAENFLVRIDSASSRVDIKKAERGGRP